MRWGLWLSAACALLGLPLACQPVGEPTEHVSLDATASALREAFNADLGKLRVVMLAAPT